MFQKVAKTGNIGKKSPVAAGIDYVRYLSMQQVKRFDVVIISQVLNWLWVN